ncbi:MAG: hypothetical protein SNJ53_00005, partial [Thermodesulfovibrionales bacterium]
MIEEVSNIKAQTIELFSKGLYTEAFDLASKAVKQYPDDRELYLIMGFCLYSLGINDMAYMWLSEALKGGDKSIYNINLWKRAYECLGKIAYS